MKGIDCAKQQGENYTVASLGCFEQLPNYRYAVPTPRGEFVVEGKVFLNQLLGLTSCEISLNQLPPGAGIPFLHRHGQNEEVYLVIQGEGEFQVDGEVFAIAQGSAVRVGTAGARSLRNISATEPLVWAVVQATEGRYNSPEIGDGKKVPGAVTWP